MKWNHLPMGGGLYNQNPQLLDRFYYILAERSKEQERQQSKRDKESGPGRMKPTSRSGGRRR